MNRQAYTTEEITEYLLGEHDEAARDQFEAALLEETNLHTQVEERETELIDNYVRGRLAAALRTRFERRARANPALQRRIAAAQVLLPRLDQAAPTPPARTAAAPLSWRQILLAAWRNQALAFQLAGATSLLLLAGGSAWMWREMGRLRGEVNQLRAAQSNDQQRAQELLQQAVTERERGAQLAAELERLRQQSTLTPPSTPSLLATLILTAEGVRGAGDKTPRVTLKPETKQLQLQLRTLPGKQPRYRAQVVAANDARLIWSSDHLKPTNRQHSAFTIQLPTNKFSAGEYLVKVEGVAADGDTFTLLNTSFVVTKR